MSDRAQLLDKMTMCQPGNHSAELKKQGSGLSHPMQPSPVPEWGDSTPPLLTVTRCSTQKQRGKGRGREPASRTDQSTQHGGTWVAGHLCLGPGEPTGADLAGRKGQVVVQ